MPKNKPEEAQREKMPKKQDEIPSIDIYGRLLEASKRKKRKERAQLLQSIGVKEFFEEGNIKIDMKTCKGVECKLCIKACPTNALYWKTGEIGITEELCVYCTACVLYCMVDNCIQVERKRANGEIERFSTLIHVCSLLERLNARNRMKTVELVFPEREETFMVRYRRPLFQVEEEKKK
jgi:Fe-S-cluster-containing hydrogenase component 2